MQPHTKFYFEMSSMLGGKTINWQLLFIKDPVKGIKDVKSVLSTNLKPVLDRNKNGCKVNTWISCYCCIWGHLGQGYVLSQWKYVIHGVTEKATRQEDGWIEHFLCHHFCANDQVNTSEKKQQNPELFQPFSDHLLPLAWVANSLLRAPPEEEPAAEPLGSHILPSTL